MPRFALAAIGATLVDFGLAEPVGVHPAWVAAAPAARREPAVLRLRVRPRRRGARGPLHRRRDPGVPAGIGAGRRVRAVDDGVGRGGTGDPAQQPAFYVDAGTAGRELPGLGLAVLLGVNIGPNLTYVGSLA